MADLFPTPKQVVPPTVIGPGTRLTILAASFPGTNGTLTITSPIANVVHARFQPSATNTTTTGVNATPDSFTLVNTRNSDGYLNPITANQTAFPDVRFIRGGTNSQSGDVFLVGRG